MSREAEEDGVSRTKGAQPRRDRRAIGLRNLPPAIVGGANTRLVRLLAALKMGSRQEWGSPTNDHIHCGILIADMSHRVRLCPHVRQLRANPVQD